jgi:hypothetical protein
LIGGRKLTGYEVAAIAGAFAWAPFIWSFIKESFTKPEISIIVGNAPEIGYTAYGSIINLPVAFAVKNKDIVISGARILIKHESGDNKVLSWQGVVQHLGRANSSEGTTPYEKEYGVLAIKLNQKDIEERFIRFQEEGFLNKKNEYEAKVLKKLNYKQQTGSADYSSIISSEEMVELCSFIKQSFSWKAGEYSLKFELDSSEKFKLINTEYKFILASSDIQELEKNRGFIETVYKNILIPQNDNEKPNIILWSWRYPRLKAK